MVLERFPAIRRLVLVADRGLLSLDNLETLQGIGLANGQPLEFILAVPGRRYSEFVEWLDDFHGQHCAGAQEEVVGEQGGEFGAEGTRYLERLLRDYRENVPGARLKTRIVGMFVGLAVLPLIVVFYLLLKTVTNFFC